MKLTLCTGAVLIAVGLVGFGYTSVPAHAFNVSPKNVSINENAVDISSQFQFKARVVDRGNGAVGFKFTNTGSLQDGTITDIYFGKIPGLLEMMTFLRFGDKVEVDPLGVSFSRLRTSSNAPQGTYDWVESFRADSPSGFQQKGIDPGESLELVFGLSDDTSFGDVRRGFKTNKSLAFAFNVQHISDHSGPNDFFASNSSVDPATIPEPITILGTVAALGFGSIFRRQRVKSEN